MKPIVIALALALTAGVLAVACGDDGGGSPTRTATASPSPVATATPEATATAAASTAGATPAPTTSSGAGEIAYFGPEGADIWLVSADGGGQRKLTEGQCQQAAGPFWSRRGDKIACVSGGTEEAPETKITIFDLEGRTLAAAEHKAWLWGFAWSADNRHFVYAISEGETLETARPSLVIGDTESEATVRLEEAGDARWSPDGSQLAYLKAAGEEPAIYDMASGQTRTLDPGLRPLAWALGGKALLVAANYQQQDIGASYKANLLDLASGEMTRVPELDNGTQFWLSRDGQAAAFLAGPAEREEGGVTVSILDLATLNVTPIEGAVIGYPSEAIPPDHIAFSADGAHLYWVDVVAKSDEEVSGTIYRARSDGSELTQLATVGAVLFAFSPDRTRVLYTVESALWVAGVDGGDARSLVENVGGRWPPAAWRPLP
jgi:dipeptidyl aminopeptidase/acylaminoacyl peptidase